MSEEASQKLLRDLNQRIGQLENEKSFRAKYIGKLEAENQLDYISAVGQAQESLERIAKLEAENERLRLLVEAGPWGVRYPNSATSLEGKE